MQSILHKSPQPPAWAELEIAQGLAQEGAIEGQERWGRNRSWDFIHTMSRVEMTTELQSGSSPTERVSKKMWEKKLSLASVSPLVAERGRAWSGKEQK